MVVSWGPPSALCDRFGGLPAPEGCARLAQTRRLPTTPAGRAGSSPPPGAVSWSGWPTIALPPVSWPTGSAGRGRARRPPAVLRPIRRPRASRTIWPVTPAADQGRLDRTITEVVLAAAGHISGRSRAGGPGLGSPREEMYSPCWAVASPARRSSTISASCFSGQSWLTHTTWG
jgi:hypothetical protein